MSGTIDTDILRIGASADFPDDTPRRVDIADRRLCVIRHEGELHAIDDLCTHGQAFLTEGEFVPEECAMECPLHGGLFNIRTGEACGAPASKPLRRYLTVIRDGEAYVKLD